MNRLLLIVAISCLTAAASAAEPAQTPRPGTIRVIYVGEWKKEVFDVAHLPDVLAGAIFDVRLALSDIPPEATARDVLNEAARKSGKPPPDFVNGVKYLRASGAGGKWILWAHSGKGRGSRLYIRELRGDDILVFDTINDRF
jgi:transposase InsO family protein